MDVDAVLWEDGWTCVEYETADGQAQLGVYVKSTMLESDPHIRPLCAACEEDGVIASVWSNSQLGRIFVLQ